MINFKDQNGWEVTLTFSGESFSKKPAHVFVICRFGNQWLLTDHRKRGYEFPGGKIEALESPEEAAIREVFEETGGIVENLQYIGDYMVDDKVKGAFVKGILFANISQLIRKSNYLETNGPVLFGGDLIKEINEDNYSFIMKDEVLKRSLQEIVKLGLLD